MVSMKVHILIKKCGDGCLTGDLDMGETLSFSSRVGDDSELYDDVSSKDIWSCK